MGKILVVIGIIIFIGILWSLPVYVCGNLFLLVFHIPFHLSFLQAFVICLLLSTIHKFIVGDKEEK